MSGSLPDESTLPALYLLWPRAPLAAPPKISLPIGYEFRPYRAGDEQALYPLFQHEGWPMTDAHWQEYLERVLPHGLFMLWHTASNTAGATAGAIHNPRGSRYYFPFGGELAYLIVHPDHRGHVVRRLQDAGHEVGHGVARGIISSYLSSRAGKYSRSVAAISSW